MLLVATGFLTCDLRGFRQGENRKLNGPIPSRNFLDLPTLHRYNLHISRVLYNRIGTLHAIPPQSHKELPIENTGNNPNALALGQKA